MMMSDIARSSDLLKVSIQVGSLEYRVSALERNHDNSTKLSNLEQENLNLRGAIERLERRLEQLEAIHE